MLWVIPKILEFLGYEPDLSMVQSLGQRIRAYRLMKGTTQKELAHRLGVDPSTLGRWERDEFKPEGDLLRRVQSFINYLVVRQTR